MYSPEPEHLNPQPEQKQELKPVLEQEQKHPLHQPQEKKTYLQDYNESNR
jgi:hypothetical protein